MKRLATLAVTALAGAGVSMIPAPAQAASYDAACVWGENDTHAPAAQSLCYPQAPGTTMVLDTNGKKAWGIRKAATHLDENVDGLSIINTRDADCADYPQYYCVTVTKKYVPDSNWVGQFYFQDWYNRTGGTIELNRFYGQRYLKSGPRWMRPYTAYHELLHSVGLWHHSQIGMMGEEDWTEDVQPFELDVIDNYYSGVSQ